MQVEREALKKLANVRNDHEKRVTELARVQDVDKQAAELISRNEPLVEQARLAVQAAIANQVRSFGNVSNIFFISSVRDYYRIL